MSIWDASGDNDRHRCGTCNDAIGLLIPAIADRIWTLGLVDRTAYEAYVRRVIALSRDELHAMAEPIRTRMRTTYAALARLFDAADDVLVRDQVAALVNSSDLLTDATITTWWVQHRYHPNAPRERG